MQASLFEGAYRSISQQVLPVLESNRGLTCIVADDPDLAVVVLAEYLVANKRGMSPESALGLLKQRMPRSNPLRQLISCLKYDG